MKNFVRFLVSGIVAIILFWIGLGIACLGGIGHTVLGFTMIAASIIAAHKGTKGLI